MGSLPWPQVIGPPGVEQVVRYLLLIAVVAVLVWVGSMLWQMVKVTAGA